MLGLSLAHPEDLPLDFKRALNDAHYATTPKGSEYRKNFNTFLSLLIKNTVHPGTPLSEIHTVNPPLDSESIQPLTCLTHSS